MVKKIIKQLKKGYKYDNQKYDYKITYFLNEIKNCVILCIKLNNRFIKTNSNLYEYNFIIFIKNIYNCLIKSINIIKISKNKFTYFKLIDS